MNVIKLEGTSEKESRSDRPGGRARFTRCESVPRAIYTEPSGNDFGEDGSFAASRLIVRSSRKIPIPECRIAEASRVSKLAEFPLFRISSTRSPIRNKATARRKAIFAFNYRTIPLRYARKNGAWRPIGGAGERKVDAGDFPLAVRNIDSLFPWPVSRAGRKEARLRCPLQLGYPINGPGESIPSSAPNERTGRGRARASIGGTRARCTAAEMEFPVRAATNQGWPGVH